MFALRYESFIHFLLYCLAQGRTSTAYKAGGRLNVDTPHVTEWIAKHQLPASVLCSSATRKHYTTTCSPRIDGMRYGLCPPPRSTTPETFMTGFVSVLIIFATRFRPLALLSYCRWHALLILCTVYCVFAGPELSRSQVGPRNALRKFVCSQHCCRCAALFSPFAALRCSLARLHHTVHV